MNVQTTICIVNWNTREHLSRCLAALRNADGTVNAEVVVVDNASHDGSAAMVRDRFPDVQLIELAENVGFAAANNLAIEQSVGDYVLVLNPDIYVRSDSVARLVEFLDAHPEAAAVGGMLVGLDGKPQPFYYRRFPSRGQVLLFYTTLLLISEQVPWLRRRFFEHDLRGDAPVPVDQIPGACCLVRRSVIDEIGSMDPDYFIWFEDVDWCYRMRQAGHALYVLPDVEVTHAGGVSFGGWSADQKTWQFRQSLFRFLCKFQLDPLIAWSDRVVRADLLLMEWLVRALRWSPVKPKRTLAKPETLAALRASIRGVVERHRRGEISTLTADALGEAMRTSPEVRS
jgi:N-acetylglucosaminyl-diphospho-decaprenol L-rhamnosyltransferase